MNTYKMYLNQKAFIFMICLIFIASMPLDAQNFDSDQELKLGLVLSGGGAKGFAHIGVLKVFEEEDIPITLISGNSIGTIIGALYATGYSADDITEFTKQQDWQSLLSDDVERRYKSRFKQDFEHKYILKLDFDKGEKKLSFPSGLVRGNNILNVIKSTTASLSDSIDFSELPIPFCCVAYNLETGKEEILTNGSLAKAMRASMAFPGVFAPVEFNGMKLLDGGIVNNFPVDVAKEMGADILIGVDLKQDKKDKGDRFGSITSVFTGIVNNIEDDKHQQNIELADIVINPELEDVSTFSFSGINIDTVIKRGEDAARKKLPEIKKLIQNKSIIQNNYYREKINPTYLISEVKIPQKYQYDSQFISSRLNLNEKNRYTTQEIEEAVKRVYAYGNFEVVTYNLIPNEETEKGYIFDLIIEDKQDRKLMLGAALNTVDVATLYANYSQLNYSNFLSMITLDAKIAVNPQLRFIMETHRLFWSGVGVEVKGRYNELNYYHRGSRLGKMDVGIASISLYTYRRFHEVGEFGFGLERFYSSSDDYSNELNELLEIESSGFSTSLYGYFTIDNRNDDYIPHRGVLFNSKLAVLENKGGFSNLIPTLDITLNTISPLGDEIAVLANLYHRSIFNADRIPVSSVNYASNDLNSYSEFFFPVLGQSGISFLKPISTLGEVGCRINIGNDHYVTPKIQTLLQFDKWNNIDMSNLKWSGGLTYQNRTRLGPVDLTLGLREMFKGINIYGGIGYRF